MCDERIENASTKHAKMRYNDHNILSHSLHILTTNIIYHKLFFPHPSMPSHLQQNFAQHQLQQYTFAWISHQSSHLSSSGQPVLPLIYNAVSGDCLYLFPCVSDNRAYNSGRRTTYNIIMSKIQAYKYNFIRRPVMTLSQTFDQEDSSKVLSQKTDYTNRIPHTTSALTRPYKHISEDEKLLLERRHEQQIAELKQEGIKERKALEVRNQQYLAELVSLLQLLSHHTPAVEDYFKPERRGSENCGRDLEREYRTAKERLEQLKPRKNIAQFALLKRSVINPERQKARPLTLKRAFDIKVPPHLTFTHTSHTSHSLLTQRDANRSSQEKHHRAAHSVAKVDVAIAAPMQLMSQKYRHCQEKARKLEQALGRETVARAQGEALIHQLNQRVLEAQMELLNLKVKAKTSSVYC